MSIVRTIHTWGEMIKFSHSIFALPFAVISAFLAGRYRPNGFPDAGQLGLILICMVSARSFAMTFNRIVDAGIDARNPRTAGRPIPAGRITKRAAWWFTLLAAALFVTGCYGFQRFFQNPWPWVLSLPTLVMLAAYSYTKRFTSTSHFVLGAAISLAPFATWIAIHPCSFGWQAILLTLAVMFWIAGFDLIYACQDVDFDRSAKLFSAPARFGIPAALRISRACHALTSIALILLGLNAGMGMVYWIGLAAAVALLAAEQAIVKPNDLSRVNVAFFTLNGVVSLVLAGAAVTDIILRAA